MKTKASRFIPFALPDIREEEISEILESLRSAWLTTGTVSYNIDSAWGIVTLRAWLKAQIPACRGEAVNCHDQS